MRRREFITLLGGAASWPLVAGAQQAGKVWRIGLLSGASLLAQLGGELAPRLLLAPEHPL